MNRLLDISIALSVTGLAVINALEAWRPGFVSVAINLGMVWLGAVLLIGIGLYIKQKTTPASS